jgi:hypothetical protein
MPFLRNRIYLVELAAINREESERAGRITPPLSHIGCELSEYWLPVDPMATPEPPTSPIPDNEDSVEIDTGGVELGFGKRSRRFVFTLDT